jgi:hypothetical protein
MFQAFLGALHNQKPIDEVLIIIRNIFQLIAELIVLLDIFDTFKSNLDIL